MTQLTSDTWISVFCLSVFSIHLYHFPLPTPPRSSLSLCPPNSVFSFLFVFYATVLYRRRERKKRCDIANSFGKTLNNSLSAACSRIDASEISLPHVTMAGCRSAIEKSIFSHLNESPPVPGLLCHPQPFPYPQPAEVGCIPGAQQSEKGLLACSAVFCLLHLQFFPSATGSTAHNNST